MDSPKRPSPMPQYKTQLVDGKPQSTATPYQIEYLITYLERNPGIAKKRCSTLSKRQNNSASWEKLAGNLNALAKNTVPKNADTWKMIWAVQKKLVMQKLEMLSSRNCINPRHQLNNRERRILSLIDSSDDEGGIQTIRQALQEKPTPTKTVPAPRAQDVVTKIHINTPNQDKMTESPKELVYSDQDLLCILGGLSDTENDMANIVGRMRPSAIMAPVQRSQLRAAETLNSTKPRKRKRSPSATPDENELGSRPATRPKRIASNTTKKNVTTLSAITPSPVGKRGSNKKTPIRQKKKEDDVLEAARLTAYLKMLPKALKIMADNDRQRNQILQRILENQNGQAQKTSTTFLSLFKEFLKLLKNK